MQNAHCPECDQRIILSPAKIGQSLTCPRCDIHLEVVGLEPLEFDWGYDWTWEESETGAQHTESGAACPECEEIIGLKSPPAPGQKLSCPSCHADLEVCCTDPLVLDPLYVETAEDWNGQTLLTSGGPE